MSVIWSGVTEQGAVVPVQVTAEGKVVAVSSVPSGNYLQLTGGNLTGDLTLGTNPSAPNITLGASGSFNFNGILTGGFAGYYAPLGNITKAAFIRGDSVLFTSQDGNFLYGVFNTAGDFKIGGIAGAHKISLNADGSGTFTGTLTATVVPPSDARFKENITPANSQLADVVALGKQLKNFDWNDKAPLNAELRAVRQLGLIAQEAEKVSPGIVKTIKRTKRVKELTPEKVTYEEVDDSYKGISHDALIMKLLGAVAELSAEVEALKSK